MARPTIVALGDSLTQGFQHGAAHRLDWSFPSILARGLGLEVPRDHRVPAFGGPGYPFNLEHMLRHVSVELGEGVALNQRLLRLPKLLAAYLDHIEDFYERGPGSTPEAHDVHYHNLASWGFTVNEALTLTARTCAAFVERDEGLIQDDLFGMPSAPMYRAAQRVLNPAANPARDDATMLDNLRALARDEPIDILLLWLGANDCLGTVMHMKIQDMPASYTGTDPFARRDFNLTSKDQFRRDYEQLLDEVAAILDPNPGRGQVYVATVPHVTIPPITNGLGAMQGEYFERYARFFRNDENYSSLTSRVLERDDAIRIDRRVDDFNDAIRSLTAARGWRIVDTAQMLDQLSIKRNACQADPGEPLRDYLAARAKLSGHDHTKHPLLALDPVPSIAAYEVRADPLGTHQRSAGGLFSLDHVHPSTIGYGLAAERFLEEIQANNPGDAAIGAARIDWDAVLLHDTLEQAPPVLWDDLMRNAEGYAWVWELISASFARHVI
ncbi:GDSL-like Lipase/Acylhydrolase [Enhygromyxa salina]|uniref:GDSL-like Lipase/Acylhydrolase n=1 Tax=Enhygromyxa salina TaxID=215803 RepID=A0A2S9YLB7_9BACT|nr:SGNH/GDSL hydrolase family protein [Enhygromyxa salina]PRQ05864.1 GDSL-like Lipase/Acylhydrolase [Enhygromyxa salina]